MSLLLVVLILQASIAQQEVVEVDMPGMLEDILCNATGFSVPSKTVLNLSTSITHHINRSRLCLLKNINDIAIVSSDPEKVADITCNTANETDMVNFTAGISFFNVSRLNLSHISITNCGSLLSETATEHANDSRFPFYFGNSTAATLLFNHCSNVTLEKVNISHYHGFAILAINMLGQSTFTDLNIQDSLGLTYQSERPPDHVPDNEGSGILMYYLDSDVSLLADSWMELSQLTLVHNFNVVTGYSCIDNVLPPQSQQFSRAVLVSAAGLSMIFTQQSFNVKVLVDGCNFTENYSSMSAAMLLLYFNQAYTSRVIVNNTLFKGNENFDPFCRGAAYVAYMYYTSARFQQCTTLLSEVWRPLDMYNTNISSHRSILTGNQYIKYGNRSGAVHIAMTYQCKLPVHVGLHNVSFDQNKALEDGVCLYAITTDTLRSGAQRLVILLEDTSAYQNGQLYFINPENSIGSIFTFVNVIANITGTSSTMPRSFSMNNGSVISVFQSLVHLNGFLYFHNNIARNGAVINLAVSSQLILHENLTAVFSNNRAKDFGGAIYKAYEDNKEDVCVIQIHSSNLTSIDNISKLNISLIFTNNTAGLSGQSIFASPVYACRQIFLSVSPSNISLLYEHIFKFDDHDTNSTENASFVSSPILVESKFQVSDIHPYQQIFPGQSHKLCVRAFDAANKTAYTVLQIDLGQKASNEILPVPWKLKQNQYMQILRSDQDCTNVTLDFLLNEHYFNDKDNNSVDVVLGLSGVGQTTTIPLQMMARCPFGFMQPASSTGCSECSQTIQNFISFNDHLIDIQCNLTTLLINKPVEIWMSLVEYNGQPMLKMATPCPVGYCTFTDNFNYQSANTSQCNNNRQGILCGQCLDGQSMVMGTTHCKKCGDVSLLAIVVPLVGGVLIIVSLFTFRITLVSGTINGLIFSANVAHAGLLDILGMAKVLHHEHPYVKSYTQFVRVFFSWLNLDVGFSVCLYDGMTALVKAMIAPLFSIYLFLLVILIGLVSRYSQRLTNIISNSAIPVLATTIHISFSRLCMASIDSFMWNSVFVENGNETAIQRVWHLDGNVQYYDTNHIVLMVGAVIVTFFLILPYLILVTFGLQLIHISFVNKYFKPFVDVVYAPYRDSQQYWFGARLFLLIFMFLIYAFFSGYQDLIVYTINGTALITFTIGQAFAAPFKNRIINSLDCWLMTNTCFFYTTTWYFMINATESYKYLAPMIISDIVGTFFFITFVAIFVYHVLLVSGCLSPLLLFVTRLKLCKFRNQWSGRHTPSPSSPTVHDHRPNYGSTNNENLTSSEMNSYSQLRESLLSM